MKLALVGEGRGKVRSQTRTRTRIEPFVHLLRTFAGRGQQQARKPVKPDAYFEGCRKAATPFLKQVESLEILTGSGLLFPG